MVSQLLSIARTDDSENFRLSSQFTLFEFKRIGNETRQAVVIPNMIHLNAFRGLTGTIVANEFITKVIELIKNMSSTRREQKESIRPRATFSSLHVRCLGTTLFTVQQVPNTFLSLLYDKTPKKLSANQMKSLLRNGITSEIKSNK